MNSSTNLSRQLYPLLFNNALMIMFEDIDDSRQRKTFKINKVSYSYRYTTSFAAPNDTAFKHDPIVGDVHRDVSKGDYWIWRKTEQDAGSSRWMKHASVHALMHPNSSASHRYSWNTEHHYWKRHNRNGAPTSITVEGVRVSFIWTGG